MGYTLRFIDVVCPSRERWAIGCVGCEKGSADCVDDEGEDSEDEGNGDPAGAEG